MRRAIAISIAFLVVAFAASGAMAQDAKQEFSERLLDILKDRISDSEYAELKALSEKMKMEDDAVASKLGEIDRSIADYLARNGSMETEHRFGMESQDGDFSIGLSGLFQFSYLGIDEDNSQDTNNFDVEENRFSFQGHAFDPSLTFFFEFDAEEVTTVTALDAWVNYDYCDWFEIRAGQMKVPFGRQWQIHESDLAFANRSVTTNWFNFDRDVGVMVHDAVALQEGGDTMFEYQAGLYNGEGLGSDGNDNNWMAWALRAGIHPFGWVDYVEGDWSGSSDLKMALAGGLFGHKTMIAGTDLDIFAWSADVTFTWMGLYLTAEYFDLEGDIEGISDDVEDDGWFVQAGYMIPNTQLEILGRYSAINYDHGAVPPGVPFLPAMFADWRNESEWAVGVAYYFQGHDLKLIAETGGTDFGVDGPDNDLDSPFFIRIVFQLDW